MMINLTDNSEKDKYILELFQTSPKEGSADFPGW